MTIKQAEVKNPYSKFLPAVGFLLLAALGYLSWIGSPYLLSWAVRTFDNFSGRELGNPLYMRLFFSGMILMFLISLITIIVSFAVPKKKSRITDKDTLKYRQGVLAEKKANELRKQKVAKMNRNSNR
ncbi:MAG: hypothetical protein ACOYLB_06585 [Phototrophicaceae bacterium]